MSRQKTLLATSVAPRIDFRSGSESPTRVLARPAEIAIPQSQPDALIRLRHRASFSIAGGRIGISLAVANLCGIAATLAGNGPGLRADPGFMPQDRA